MNNIEYKFSKMQLSYILKTNQFHSQLLQIEENILLLIDLENLLDTIK